MNYSKISLSLTILLASLFAFGGNSAEAASVAERINSIMRNTPTTEECANKSFLYESRGSLILHLCAHRCFGGNRSANIRDLDLQHSSIEASPDAPGYSWVVIPCRSGTCITNTFGSLYGANQGQGCGTQHESDSNAIAKFYLPLLDRDADEVLNLVRKLQ
jgi:hypothetical protein